MKELAESSDSTEVMAEDYHDDFNTAAPDDVAFWTKGSAPRLFLPMARSRWSVWVLPSVCSVLILTLIIALSVSSMKADRRFSSVEDSVTQLSSLLQQTQTSAAEAKKESERLSVSMETAKQQLDSVSESVKSLDDLDSLRQKVANLRCTVDSILKNDTAPDCCPLDWELFSSSCYLFSSSSLSWNDARDFCLRNHGHLVVLRTREEWAFLGRRADPVFYWVGLSDERTGTWEWVDGTQYVMDRRDWMPGQPDDWEGHGLGGTEDCAHFHTGGRLNDLHCSETYRFICQSPPL